MSETLSKEALDCLTFAAEHPRDNGMVTVCAKDLGALLANRTRLEAEVKDLREQVAELKFTWPTEHVIYSACAQHSGMPWSVTGSAVMSCAPLPRVVCPICHPPGKAP